MNMNGWQRLSPCPEDRHFQVLPVADLRPHILSKDCWCQPDFDEEFQIITHNAMDEREKFERGERRLS